MNAGTNYLLNIINEKNISTRKVLVEKSPIIIKILEQYLNLYSNGCDVEFKVRIGTKEERLKWINHPLMGGGEIYVILEGNFKGGALAQNHTIRT